MQCCNPIKVGGSNGNNTLTASLNLCTSNDESCPEEAVVGSLEEPDIVSLLFG